MKKWVALSLCMALLAGCGGCQQVNAVQDLSKNAPAVPKDCGALSEEDASLLTAAAVRLLQNSDTTENVLLSPLSVLCAIGMTANGAAANTEEQIAAALGMDIDTFNRCMGSWLQSQEGHEGLLAANSVWVNSGDMKVSDAFLQSVAGYYGANSFQGAFSTETLGQMNGWVNEQTDGMIPEILDILPENAVMYLLNALCFRRSWQEPYTTDKVHDGEFTAADGKTQTVQMMSSKEDLYLENDAATGFIKPYEGGKYAFAALLPAEGTTANDLIASLSGEGLISLLTNAAAQPVNVRMPKFSMEYDAELSGTLQAMGITDAFSPDAADFSDMGTASDNVYISRVLHKTYISVNETGTEAAAATAVEMMTKMMRPVRNQSVILDRPFVYMIIDTETNIPVFIGVMNEIP